MSPNLPEVVLTTPRFRIVRHQLALRDGRTQDKYTIQHPGSVVMLPILDDGRVCLIRNVRLSVGRTLIELPAGTLSPGEDPLLAAQRELREETGYAAEQWEKMFEFYPAPGLLDERMHLYLARGLRPGPQQLEDDEQIEPLLLPFDEALALVQRQEIRDAKTLFALLYYERFLRSSSPQA